MGLNLPRSLVLRILTRVVFGYGVHQEQNGDRVCCGSGKPVCMYLSLQLNQTIRRCPLSDGLCMLLCPESLACRYIGRSPQTTRPNRNWKIIRPWVEIRQCAPSFTQPVYLRASFPELGWAGSRDSVEDNGLGGCKDASSAELPQVLLLDPFWLFPEKVHLLSKIPVQEGEKTVLTLACRGGQ